MKTILKKVWRITSSLVLVVILALIMLLVALKFCLDQQNQVARHAAQAYITTAYDFPLQIRTSGYDFKMDYYTVEIVPAEECGEPDFEVTVAQGTEGWQVTGDTFLQQKLAGWLEQAWQEELEALWGKDLSLEITVTSRELCRAQADGTVTFDPATLLKMPFDNQVLDLYPAMLPQEVSLEEAVSRTMELVRQTAPEWQTLNLHLPLTEETAYVAR